MAERTCRRCDRSDVRFRPNRRVCRECEAANTRAAFRAKGRPTEDRACSSCGAVRSVRKDKRPAMCSRCQRHRAGWLGVASRRTEVSAYKRALRSDPCAYCGVSPAGGIDHIVPTGKDGDRSDWENMTACCKRCNELKGSLPLLTAMLWVPVARDYHDFRRRFYPPKAA